MKFVHSITLVMLPLCICLGQGVDYYWVGGSGDWSDITHWSSSSGGNVQHSVLPTVNDNVIFDENSFKQPGESVNINRDNVFCKNMDWSKVSFTPALKGDLDYIININGSLTLHPGIDFQYAGSFYFSGSNDNVIDFAGHEVGNNLTINGEQGSNWILGDSTYVINKFLLQGGNFQSNNYNLHCNQFFIESKNLSTIDISNSALFITGGVEFLNPSLRLRSDNIDLINSNTSIIFQGEFSYLQVIGSRLTALERLVFEHPAGKSYVQAETQYYLPAPLQINRLEFYNNGYIYGSNQLNYLKLDPGNSYQFENKKIQKIDILDANGSCTEPITISSTIPGDASIFEFAQMNNLTYVNLWDIHVSSTNSSAASITEATAGQNVIGWNLQMRTAKTLFWVGGSGKWSDPANWSLTSGGAGGACIPTFIDDVIFDANSFSLGREKVSVDVQDIYFKSMHWSDATGNPVFEGTKKQNVHIHGSISLQIAMEWSFKGNIYFDAFNETHTINLNGHLMHQDLFFEGFKATWYMESDLKVKERIVFNRSTLYTNSHRIEVESFESYGSFTRALYLENSYVLVRSTRNYLVNWALEKVNFIFDAGNSTIEFTGHQGVFNNIGNAQFDSIYYYTIIFSGEKSSSISNKAFKTLIKYAYYTSNVTLRGNHSFDELTLSPGFSYSFGANGEVFTIDLLIANGDCNQPISLQSQSQSEQAIIRSNNAQQIYYVTLEGISIEGNGSFEAYNATDLGNNSGWLFSALAARKLYWIGNSGSWHDPQNWSLVAGGAGGECLPTPSDEVIFDEHSFPLDNMVIFAEKDKIATCHDFIWDHANATTTLNLGEIHSFGSFRIKSKLKANIERLKLRGIDQHYLNLGSIRVNNLDINTTGTYQLTGKVSAGVITFTNGHVITDGQPIQARFFDIQAYSAPCVLDCSNSTMTFTGEGSKSRGSLSVYGNYLDLLAHGSSINLTHENAKLYVHGELAFDQVNFTSKIGQSSVHSNALSPSPKPVVRFELLKFKNNAEIIGPHEMDSLLFSAGKGYILESGVTQKINEYWQMRGNNCSQIKLSASSPGIHSIVEKTSGDIHADFVQMQDQMAQGGANFYAGYNSTDINNSNIGWQYVTQDEDLLNGVLGADKSLCRNESILLNGRKTIEAENYEWSDGTVGETIKVDVTGTYWLKASFTQNCTIIDSVLIEVHNDLKPELGSDTTICAGEDIILQTDQKINSAEYSWNTGTVGYTIQATSEGDYILTAVKDQCVEADTITIQVFDPSEDVIPAVMEACENSVIELAIHLPDVDVIWNTGSRDKTIKVDQEGTYWATIIKSGCSWKDTTIVSFLEGPTTDLPDTVQVCEDERVILDVTLRIPLGDTYAEYTRPFIDSMIEETQHFYYFISDGNCPLVDSILVSVQDIPYLLVDSVVEICPNTGAILLADTDAEEIIWSNGSKGPTLSVDQPGNYTVLAAQKGCIAEKSIQVETSKGFSLSLPKDTLICLNTELFLDASVPEGINYKWSNGSTDSYTYLQATGTHWVEVSDNNCSQRDSINIKVHNCEAIEVFIPNIFSPNGDGYNDQLMGYISTGYQVHDFKMQVFDRWGNRIFESMDIDFGWDGRKDGKFMDSQVYVCVISISYQHPEGIKDHVFSGDVFLNR